MAWNLYKDKKSDNWFYSITGIGPKQVRKSTRTTSRKLAEQKAIEAEKELYERYVLKRERKKRVKWKDAWQEWLKYACDNRKDFGPDITRLRVLNNKFDEDGIKYYDELTREYILNALAELQEEREWSVASVNRYSAILTRVSNILYKDLELIDKPLKLPKKSEKNERLVWLTKTEARRFIDNVYDSHQQQVRFAFATGLRRGNVYGLEWKWVDMSQRLIRIPAENMKAGKALNVPLNDDAVKIIKEQIGEHDQFVFGVIKPAKSTLWKKWVIKADIRSDFTFHCIRHSWASWLVQSGLPLHVLQELGGWADYKMVLRYAHLAPSQLHDAAKTSELGQVEKVKLKEVK